MKDKPIVFSTPMVAALLNTKPDAWPAEPIDPAKPWKWQTRRTIDVDISNNFDVDADGSVYSYINPETGDSYKPQDICKYRVGTKLWVQETWKCIKYDNMDGDLGYGVKFKDGTRKYFEFDDHERFHQFGKFASKNGWQSPYFIPKEAARIWLEVMGVRVEKIQDISIDDAIAEGCFANFDPPDGHGFRSEAINLFRELWDNLNAKRGFSFESNPWVWVYELRRVER